MKTNKEILTSNCKLGLLLGFSLFIIFYCTGCFLNPVKNYKSFPDGRTEWNFNTGLNLEFGASATDTLDNQKSIKPATVN